MPRSGVHVANEARPHSHREHLFQLRLVFVRKRFTSPIRGAKPAIRTRRQIREGIAAYLTRILQHPEPRHAFIFRFAQRIGTALNLFRELRVIRSCHRHINVVSQDHAVALLLILRENRHPRIDGSMNAGNLKRIRFAIVIEAQQFAVGFGSRPCDAAA